MTSIIKKTEEWELKKHVNAIHCTNNLSLIQRKLFNALLFNAYSELPHKSQFQITARSLCKLIGYNSNDYDKLKKSLLALMTVAIEWNIVDYSTLETQDKWRASAILSAVKLDDGMCTYEYSSIMRELLHRPEIYGRINMAILPKFKSSYALALYENCVRYQGLPQTPWFTLEVFRRLMGVLDGKYLAFKDFKKRVLDIAVKEVSIYAPITIVPELKRKNQKVISIRFKLTEHDSLTTSIDELHDNKGDLVSDLVNNFGFSPESIKEIFARYDSAYIRQKADIILNSASFRAAKIKDLAGYLIDALKKDYQASLSSQEVRMKNQQQQQQIEQQTIQLQQQRERLYQQYVTTTVKHYVSQLSLQQQEELIKQFGRDLQQNHSIVFLWYKRHGLKHPGVSDLFNKYITKNKSHEMGPIESFSEFIAKPCSLLQDV